MVRLAALAGFALASACYSPSYRDCQLACASGTCPSGLECTAGMCRLPGMTGACVVDPMIDASGSDARPGLTVEMYFQAALASICDYDARCGVFETEAACNTVLGNLLTLDSASIVAAVNAGKAEFHPDRAAACLAAREQLTCKRDNARIAGADMLPCNTVFSGTVGSGGTCALNEECVSQNCGLGNCPPGACCTGMCIGGSEPAVKTVGQPCSTRDICVDSYCDGANGACTDYLALGAPCSTSDACPVGARCANVAAGAQCANYASTGTPCSTSQDCANTADVCRNGGCLTGGLTADPCVASGECQELHYCGDSATGCQLPPNLNESCASSGFCSAGYCDPTTMVCTPKKQNGQPCSPTIGNECTSGYCDTTMANPSCGTRPTCI